MQQQSSTIALNNNEVIDFYEDNTNGNVKLMKCAFSNNEFVVVDLVVVIIFDKCFVTKDFFFFLMHFQLLKMNLKVYHLYIVGNIHPSAHYLLVNISSN